MKKVMIVGLVLVLSLGTLLVSGCELFEGDAAGAEEEIKIAHGDWACATAKTYLVAGILEQEMDYEVELTMAELGMIFTDLASGDQDVNVAGWLPATHESYMEEHGDNLDNLGTIYENARIGLVVPEYVDIDSIEEMGDHYDKFDGQIVGIDSGAGIMRNTNDAIEQYDSLSDFDLLASSEASMVTELRGAVQDEEWIAVTGWTPHWKFAEWDLKFLEDPELIYGEAERIDVITRSGFKEDVPEAAEFLEDFYITDEQLGELMRMIDESGEQMESVLEWMEDNQDVVDEWLGR